MPAPRIEIQYCIGCQWHLRAGWYAQELLFTFGQELGEVALVPTDGGKFIIRCDEEVLWDRKERGGFPQAAELKRLVRDRVDPERDLGHVEANNES